MHFRKDSEMQKELFYLSKVMEILINFQSVDDAMPSATSDEYYGYSIECMAIVDGEVFDRSVKYCMNYHLAASLG
jgi:hypothetical protein